MAGAMPPHIKANFIYARLWSLTRYKDMNAVLLFVGDVGSGKSTGALRFAEDLDRSFTLNRVCYSVEKFLGVVNEKGLKPGSVIIFDEAAGSGEGMDSRESLTHTNKIVSWFATISRAKRLVIIYVCPFLKQLDKRVRTIGITGIANFRKIDRKEKKGIADFYWRFMWAMSDTVASPRPRVFKDDMSAAVSEIAVPLPRRVSIAEYKAGKNAFIAEKVGQWQKEVVAKQGGRTNNFQEVFEKCKGLVDELKDSRGKISTGLIRLKMGVGDNMARSLKNALVDFMKTVETVQESV